MRKTLAVLALMISSILLLQAPTWAQDQDHHLYKIKQGGSFVALSDCPEGQILIRPNKGASFQPWKLQGTEAYGSGRVNRFFRDKSVPFNPAKLEATCKGEAMIISRTTLLGTGVPRTSLPLTGRPLVPQLVLGIGLLLVGGLFVALTVHPSLAGFRRRRPRPTTPS
jgi:hypothetical protein